jgi:hypothetical protein
MSNILLLCCLRVESSTCYKKHICSDFSNHEGLPAEKAVATFGDESVELTEVWIVAMQDNKGYVVNYYVRHQTNGRNTHRHIRGDGAKRGDKAAMTEVNDEHGRISFLV